MIEKILKKLYRTLIRPEKTYTVFIEDRYYDFINDNDDMTDTPTIAKVTYNNYGEILDVEHVDTWTYGTVNNGLSHSEISSFYKICGINRYGGLPEYKKYSTLRDEK